MAGNPASQATELIQSPIIGAVRTHRAKVLIRTDQSATIQIEYATNPIFMSSLFSDTKNTKAAKDFTTKFPIRDLLPDQVYYYNVLVDEAQQFSPPFPSFSTFPEKGTKHPFKLMILTNFEQRSKIQKQLVKGKDVNQTFHTTVEEDADLLFIGGNFDHAEPSTLEEFKGKYREVYVSNPVGLPIHLQAFEVKPQYLECIIA